MWTREQLKTNAKASLRRFHWAAVLVCLITLLLSGSGGFQINFKVIFDVPFSDSEFLPILAKTFLPLSVGGLFSLLLSIFVCSVLEVGSSRFFLIGRERLPSVSILLDPFRANYGNIVIVMLLRRVFIFLWGLLFVIPGIVKSYAYRMVPYLLAENPNLGYKRALELSSAMMNGHKMEAFILDLSFIGWYLLSAITVNIVGVLYVNPYVQATNAEFYTAIRSEAFSRGITGPDELPGTCTVSA